MSLEREHETRESYPRVHLAIDNCFASKRWTRPSEWMTIVENLGIKYVEASADTECDPLYMESGYLEDWIDEVRTQSDHRDVRVSNLYSGHGTYATLGLAHTDVRIRDRFQHDWVEALVRIAEKLGAGVGFYCHAFNDDLLQSNADYTAMVDELYGRFSELAAFADSHGETLLGVEQMYAPHQIPWTIDGALELLRDVYARAKKPFYITLDTGHQSVQSRFMRPSKSELRRALLESERRSESYGKTDVWLGTRGCEEMFDEWRKNPANLEKHIDKMMSEMAARSYLFARRNDSDPYAWIEALGCYSPIIHLQQTSGESSSHQPFTQAHNSMGIISAEKVLKSLAASFEAVLDSAMPPRVTDIYLTLEIFFATASFTREIIRELEESVAYWRRFLPEDGVRLDEIVASG